MKALCGKTVLHSIQRLLGEILRVIQIEKADDSLGPDHPGLNLLTDEAQLALLRIEEDEEGLWILAQIKEDPLLDRAVQLIEVGPLEPVACLIENAITLLERNQEAYCLELLDVIAEGLSICLRALGVAVLIELVKVGDLFVGHLYDGMDGSGLYNFIRGEQFY